MLVCIWEDGSVESDIICKEGDYAAWQNLVDYVIVEN